MAKTKKPKETITSKGALTYWCNCRRKLLWERSE